MKTHEEIKKGLGSCSSYECLGNHTDCPYFESDMCMTFATGDALAYIKQLEAELAAVKRERDAAVKDIKKGCTTCKWHEVTFNGCSPDHDCTHDYVCDGLYSAWEWRGVCSENGGVE